MTLSRTSHVAELQVDAQTTARAPDGRSAVVLVVAKRRVSPRQAAEAANKYGDVVMGLRANGVLDISDYLSELSRKRLRAGGGRTTLT